MAPPRLVLLVDLPADASPLAEPLARACRAADVATVILRLPAGDERALIRAVKAVAPGAQEAGAAVLVEDAFGIVARSGSDGVHLTSAAELGEALDALRPHDRIVGLGGVSTRHDAMEAGEAGADYLLFAEAGAEASTGRASAEDGAGGEGRDGVRAESGERDDGDAGDGDAGDGDVSDAEAGDVDLDDVDEDDDARLVSRPMTALELAAWWAESFEIPCIAAATDASPGAIARAAATGAEFVALPLATIGPDAEARVAAAAAGLRGDRPSAEPSTAPRRA